MIQKLQKLRAKKGFTLTELIIVIAILAVMMAAVAAFSYPVQRMVKSTSMTADAINVNELVGEYIRGRLAYSDFLYLDFAVDSALSSTEITDSLTAVKSRLSGTTGGKAGVLIFRYTPDAVEPEKSSYTLYDFPIVNTTIHSNFLNPTGGLSDDGKVFNDEFYGSTQRIIYLEHRLPKVNSVRGEVYLNFEILSYAGDPGYMEYNALGAVDDANSVYLSPTTLSSVYQEAEATPPTTATLERLGVIKKGDANTSSFVLQNFTQSMLSSYSDFRMYPDQGTPITGTAGDVMIFYHIPTFTA